MKKREKEKEKRKKRGGGETRRMVEKRRVDGNLRQEIDEMESVEHQTMNNITDQTLHQAA